MRGVQFSVLIIFWMIAVGMIVLATWSLPFMGGGKEQALVKTDIYMMGNSLDAASSYMGAALQYSNYQACFDSINALDGKALPDSGTFSGSFRSALLGNVNSYASMGYSFAKRYSVSIPEYSSVEFSSVQSHAVATIFSGGKMSVKAPVEGARPGQAGNLAGEASLSMNANTEARLKLDCAAVFASMKEAESTASGMVKPLLESEAFGLAAGFSSDTAAECGDAILDAEERIMESLQSGSGFDVELASLNLGFALHTPTEKGSDGRFRCVFDKVEAPSASLKVTMKATASVPVSSGGKVGYAELRPSFLVDVAAG